jgi:hypothetical protein
MSNDSKYPSQDGDAAKEVKQQANQQAEVPVLSEEQSAAEEAAELKMLIKLLLQQQKKTLVADAAVETARIARQKQRNASAIHNFHKRGSRQTRCLHEKGGAHRNKKISDPSVYMHRYIDGTLVIKCQGCNFAWKEGDTKKYITRFGVKQPNVTRLGWADALEMLARSTNTMTSSEIPTSAKPPVIPLPGGESEEETADSF